jgi:2'-5' RNA ligase
MDSVSRMYFLAILPAVEVSEEVTGFKEYLAVHFGARHALKSPPHITLFPPFRWPDAGLELLCAVLGDFAALRRPFELSVKDFNCFDERVLFVDVELCLELEALERALASFLEDSIGLAKKQNFGFHPHMTIANRDLNERNFSMARDYFFAQCYRRTFSVESICCLKYDGNLWEVYRTFSMGSLQNMR